MTATLQIKVEESLKDEAAKLFERLGIDTSTAVRIFLKRSVMENGLPFRMTMPKEEYNAERGYRAMQEISDGASKNGLADMSLDEINAEIDSYRKERALNVK